MVDAGAAVANRPKARHLCAEARRVQERGLETWPALHGQWKALRTETLSCGALGQAEALEGSDAIVQ